MSIQLSVAVGNARLDAIETAIGTSPTLRIRTGAAPLNNAANRQGTVLATIALPADWMAAAAGRSKAMSGTWADNAADAAGNAGHFEIVDGAGVCHLQGTVSAAGGGGDMELNNVVFAAGQPFSITVFTLADNNG